MTETIGAALVFFLPAGIANLSPVLANKIPLLNRWTTPLDFGLKQSGKRLFGDNKTWRGVVFGSVMGALTAWVVYNNAFLLGTVIHANSGLLLGGLMGLGALVGDAVGSYVKRRMGIAEGRSWFPIDQLDYIIGGLLFVWPLTDLTLTLAVWILVIFFGLHVVFSYLAYLLGLKPSPI